MLVDQLAMDMRVAVPSDEPVGNEVVVVPVRPAKP